MTHAPDCPQSIYPNSLYHEDACTCNPKADDALDCGAGLTVTIKSTTWEMRCSKARGHTERLHQTPQGSTWSTR